MKAMPELPEVEHIVRHLAGPLTGRRIERVAFVEGGRYVRRPGPIAFRRRLAGSTIEAVERRGKWIVMTLRPSARLVIHLKMTGKLWLERAPARRGRPVGWSLELEGERALVYEDQRKFGWIDLVDEEEYRTMSAGLGPEPLDPAFRRAVFEARLTGRRGRLKPILLDPSFVAGIGNIYADEILWAARLHPLDRAIDLDPDAAAALYRSTRRVLRKAVDERSGEPDQQRVGAGGRGAARRLALSVFQRTGQPCPRCRTPIERIVVASRGTHICPTCQPGPG